jgi:tetratricopeptide (TPR) repeat protein
MDVRSNANLLQEGFAALRENRVDEAIRLITEFLNEQPNNGKARELLGIAYSQKKMYPEAVEEFRKAVALMPRSASVHFNLGTAYEKMGRSDLAKGEYYQTLQYDPKHVRARQRLEALGAPPPQTDAEVSLKRISCPRCRTLNTEGELTCFACGQPLVSKPPTVAPGVAATGIPRGAVVQSTDSGSDFPWGILIGVVVAVLAAVVGYFVIWPKLAGG